MVFTRWKTLVITGFCGKLPRGALRHPRSRGSCSGRAERVPGPRSRPNRASSSLIAVAIPAHQGAARLLRCAAAPFREPDSAEYRYSQPPKERGIRCNQRRAQLSVVPSGRGRGHEIHAYRKQPPHEEARCQREVRRSWADQGRSHQQRYWTSAGQSERGHQHAQRHRRPEEQDRLPEIHQINQPEPAGGYSTRRSCDGEIRGDEGKTTSAPLTVR